MKYRLVLSTALLALAINPGVFLSAADRGLPITKGGRVLATVNGDSISVDDLEFQLESPVEIKHLQDGHADAKELELIDRLITIRLIAQEGATMGLNDLADIRKQVDVTSRSIIRDVLKETVTKDVVADEAEVDAFLKDKTSQWKTESLLFSDEATATSVRDTVASGGDFQKAAAAAVAANQAKTEGDDSYHGPKDYLPEVADAIARLKTGEVSPVIHIKAGFVVVRVRDIRYDETAEGRTLARKIVLDRARQTAFEKYQDALIAKNVVIKKDVLDAIDYEAKEPGVDALAKDTRVVAEIKGADPVTVADLTDFLKLQFYHGGDDASLAKRLNSKKDVGLEATAARRALNAEALALGLDKSDSYLSKVRAFEDSLVFDAFVQKVIVPDSKMREEEVKAYYQQHLKDYSYPGMVRIRTLAFTKRGDAEEATEKLRNGTDFGWLAANADDQVGAADRTLNIPDGKLVMSDGLPDAVQTLLAESKQGDVRLYATPEGQFYVLAVQDVRPPNPRPYEEVREDIARKLYGEKLTKNVEAYAAKLRALSKIEIHVKKMP